VKQQQSQPPRKPPNLARVAALANVNRSPELVVVGDDRTAHLRAHPEEHHYLPPGQSRLHSLSTSCGCRPRVQRSVSSWWIMEYRHHPLGLEAEDAIPDEQSEMMRKSSNWHHGKGRG
jgi:hypothetical protein